MLGPYYVNTDARRRAAWGPPCQPDLEAVVIAGHAYACERAVAPAFRRLEQIRAKWGFRQEGADTGFYSCRRMRHDPDLPYSVHAWARALDWDWLQNPAGNKLVTNMPAGMIAELQAVKTVSGAFVFMWGGDWDRNPRTGHTYLDPMHFEVIAHPLDLATGIAGAAPPRPIEEDDMALKPGDRGNAVRAIQKALNAWQPALALLDDAIYGPATAAAVKQYQQAANLPVTGDVDGVTAAFVLRYL